MTSPRWKGWEVGVHMSVQELAPLRVQSEPTALVSEEKDRATGFLSSQDKLILATCPSGKEEHGGHSSQTVHRTKRVP